MIKNRKLFKYLASIRSGYITLLLVLTVIVLVVNALQFFFLGDLYENNAKRNMISLTTEIEALDFERKSFFKDISEIEAQNNIYVEIYSPEDELIYTSNTNSWVYDLESSATEHKLKPRIMKVLGHKDIDKQSYFETRQEYYASAKYIVYSHSEGDQTVEVYYSDDLIEENARTASRLILAISIIFLFLSVVLLVTYVSIFIVPLERINNIAGKLVKMDFDETCPSFRIKELDQLSGNINALSASLKLTLRDLKAKNIKLQQDIEKEHQLEKDRKQFIANASHELKTPISIIQGYAEGLKYGITNGKEEEYYDTIIEETQKMNNLVIRLLEIMRFDNSDYKTNFTQFNILEFLEESLSAMKYIINEADITLKLDVDSLYKGYGDRNILTHVFENYLSNAVSHCENEKFISVSCKEHDAAYRISVFNTGKQISKEDIPHIWESFYRADKAHSRANGRFGLGLSIVASFQHIHKQKYGVVNHPDGVEFWFDISKYPILN